MPVSGFDHVAIPTARPGDMIRFYRKLGFRVPDPDVFEKSGSTFFSIHFGDQKINVHCPGLWDQKEFDLRGPTALPGCADLCFVWQGGMDGLLEMLREAGAAVTAGPVDMIGGRDWGEGRGRSVYIRDPEENLLEFIVYDD